MAYLRARGWYVVIAARSDMARVGGAQTDVRPSKCLFRSRIYLMWDLGHYLQSLHENPKVSHYRPKNNILRIKKNCGLTCAAVEGQAARHCFQHSASLVQRSPPGASHQTPLKVTVSVRLQYFQIGLLLT